jgi:hypothetical protein
MLFEVLFVCALSYFTYRTCDSPKAEDRDEPYAKPLDASPLPPPYEHIGPSVV